MPQSPLSGGLQTESLVNKAIALDMPEPEEQLEKVKFMIKPSYDMKNYVMPQIKIILHWGKILGDLKLLPAHSVIK